MRLRDLDPKMTGTNENGWLRFDCPLPGHSHSIRVPLGTSHWTASGEFPDTLTLTPSVNADSAEFPCWHGHITNGEVK